MKSTLLKMHFTKIILVLAVIFTSLLTNVIITSGSITYDREKVTSRVRVIVPHPDNVSIIHLAILGSHTLILSWSVYGICKENHNLVPITSLFIVLWTMSFNIIRQHHVRIVTTRIWFLSTINFLLVVILSSYCLLAKIFKKKKLHISCYYVNTETDANDLDEKSEDADASGRVDDRF